jgi:hypothetical protein
VGGFDDILARAKQQSPRLAASATERGPLSTLEAAGLVTKIAYANFAGLMCGTQLASGKGMMAGLLRSSGIETFDSESDGELKARLIQIAADGFLEVERVLSALPGKGLHTLTLELNLSNSRTNS